MQLDRPVNGDDLKDEFTLSRGKLHEVKNWQSQQRRIFAADIIEIARQNFCGITTVVCGVSDENFGE